MKRNVDLTENRFFSSNVAPIFSLTSLINEKEMPWTRFMKKLTSDDDINLEHQRNAIIAVGNKETRAKVKFYREMDSFDYCDCCGKRMNLKPWDKEIGICHQCNDYYLKDEDRCKWRKKEIIRNATII